MDKHRHLTNEERSAAEACGPGGPCLLASALNESRREVVRLVGIVSAIRLADNWHTNAEQGADHSEPYYDIYDGCADDLDAILDADPSPKPKCPKCGKSPGPIYGCPGPLIPCKACGYKGTDHDWHVVDPGKESS